MITMFRVLNLFKVHIIRIYKAITNTTAARYMVITILNAMLVHLQRLHQIHVCGLNILKMWKSLLNATSIFAVK